jgi:hypothetical protein
MSNEHDEEAGVVFPPDAVVGVEFDQAVVSEVVRRTRQQLL